MKLVVAVSLPLVCLLLVGCVPARNFDTSLGSIVKSYRFSILKWESATILHELNQWIFGKHKKIDNEVQIVTEYFTTVARIKSLRSEGDQASLRAELNRLQERKIALEDTVERIIARQIKESLGQQGIFNPIDKYIRLKVSFPPLNFKLEKPPHLLVISPRDRIETTRKIVLRQNLSLEEIKTTEAEVDKLGVSSLVVELGGYLDFVVDLFMLTENPLVCLLLVGCVPARNFDTSLGSIVKSYRFSILKWESATILHELNQWIFGKHKKIDNEVQIVTEYFTTVARIKSLRSEGDQASLRAELNRLQERKIALEDTVERIIARQIKESLGQQGIFNPIDKYIRLKVSFPPLNFKLEKPPHLLVISPRDRIETTRKIVLRQNLSLEEIKTTEAEVDKLGVSSLVVELGGLSTYPSFVTDDANLRFTIDTAAEEWIHQYLVFKPLGFRYLLDLIGVSKNYEIATLNETAASMISKEISSVVYGKYYSQYENGTNQSDTEESGVDFNREMGEIRRVVDEYLAQGEIEQAEEFMEQKRQYLASMGHYIRKLNQAYFAFHGAYADRPTSIDPIGFELKELRSQSASLKDFLDTVAGITSRQELRDSLG